MSTFSKHFKMEKSKSGFCLTEAAPVDNKNKYISSSGVNLAENRGQSLSPPASADKMAAPNTGCSTTEGSVFTFNSMTDESSDEKKSEPSSPVRLFEEGIIFTCSDTKDKATPSNNASTYCDKKDFIKMVVKKEYIHVVRYNYLTLLEKIKEIQAYEEAEKCRLFKEYSNKENETKENEIYKGVDGDESGSSSFAGGNIGKEKFSSRVLKNLFSIVTSPVSDRKIGKSPIHQYHRKKSKSSSSPSLAKTEGKGKPKGNEEASHGEGKNRSTQSEVEIVKEGVTV